MSYYPRVLVGVIVLTSLLVVAVGVAHGDGVRASSPENPETENVSSRLDAVTLIVLVLVGGTALLAGSVWLSQMRRLLPQ